MGGGTNSGKGSRGFLTTQIQVKKKFQAKTNLPERAHTRFEKGTDIVKAQSNDLVTRVACQVTAEGSSGKGGQREQTQIL